MTFPNTSIKVDSMKKSPTKKTPAYDAHIKMDKDLWEKLDRLAKVEDRPISSMIRALVKEALLARQVKGD